MSQSTKDNIKLGLIGCVVWPATFAFAPGDIMQRITMANLAVTAAYLAVTLAILALMTRNDR